MAIFKCKMCGGTLEISNEKVAICEYCGTQQTLPKLDDEKRMQMYDRANHFRRNNEFDKAMGIYEKILNEDNTDAEAYWSLVLCRYGIEYVEDPSSHKRVPTVNRAQFTSVFDDDNYKSALEYADEAQQSIYEEEAKIINEIQKGILAISQKEEPFDVFICYKETDNNGRRTHDSVLANDLYHQLKQEGFKVFFARITLEDKLGTAYEPYIFAALNSAKVMVVLGTKAEFFNAVWVKNEWSRYLALIKNGANKMLIPAYKDMDPYDLPEEFSHLQAQDMSKLGFMQDLIRGIKKIIKTDETKQTVVKETVVSAGNSNTAPLLERVFMFLEDGDWQSADEYCEKVLDINPKCARAYLGKLMSELRVHTEDKLHDCKETFDDYDNYSKVMRFADEPLKEKLTKDIEYIKTRNENERIEGIYNQAIRTMNDANDEFEYKTAARLFEKISGYEDSDNLVKECYDKAETARKDEILSRGKSKISGFLISNYEEAIKILEPISGWKDADEWVSECRKKIQELKDKSEAERIERERKAEMERVEIMKRRERKMIAVGIIALIFALMIAAFHWYCNVVIPNKRYNEYEEVLKNCEVGDYITFGGYEQDGDKVNGKENIEWLVLDKAENYIFVISEKILEMMAYNETFESTSWENCTLRKWLNEDFYNASFGSKEKNRILTVTLPEGKNEKVEDGIERTTKDKVFLISVDEANKYLDSDTSRMCCVSDYVWEKAFNQKTQNSKYKWWWLRSQGESDKKAAAVSAYGYVMKSGYNISLAGNGVRPAMCIEIPQ